MSSAVTVLIPAWNTAPYLGAALESALGQTCVPTEVVVVDDGSTDGTAEVAERYQPRVRLVRRPHGGAAAAKNLGVREARTPLVAFLDSDDLWHRDHLETLLGLLRGDPRALGATSGMEILASDGTPSGQAWIFGSDGEDFETAVRKGCPFLTSASAVRREAVLEAGGFDESLSTADDWDLWLRLLPRGRFARAGRATAGYRRRAGALSTDLEARARNRRRIAAKYAALPWGHELAAYMEVHDARQALAEGREREGKASLERAARLYPDVTADLQWWAFFESFRPHDRPQGYPRARFWQAVRACGRVCSSRALPFRGAQRRRALGAGLVAAAAFARLGELGPESVLFRGLVRLTRAAGGRGERRHLPETASD